MVSAVRKLIVSVPKRVLIVEDDLCIQESVKELLRRIDHELMIDCEQRADKAETLLRRGKLYDLVIVDLSLAGGTNGLDLWRSCNKAYTYLNFLFISSISPAEFINKVGAGPIPPFLPKPFSMLEGAQTFRSMLERQD